MENNLVFIDNAKWSKIEAALSPKVQAKIGEIGHTQLHVDDVNKGWRVITVYDAEGEPINLVRGGNRAEREYLADLKAYEKDNL